jgi:hypothetical protein
MRQRLYPNAPSGRAASQFILVAARSLGSGDFFPALVQAAETLTAIWRLYGIGASGKLKSRH